MNKTLAIGIVAALAIVLVFFALYTPASAPDTATPDQGTDVPSPIPATPTPTPPPVGGSTGTVLPYGNVTVKLGQLAQFKDISIKPISIEEDSRCPSDVQCIQAGTVRVKLEVASALGKSTSIVKLDQEFTTEGEAITLTNVLPGKNSKVTIHPSDYSLTFNVIKQGTKPPTTSGKCYVGGCSRNSAPTSPIWYQPANTPPPTPATKQPPAPAKRRPMRLDPNCQALRLPRQC
jgi:hypothetical protein